MANPNIKDYARLGGRARMAKLTSNQRACLAKSAVDARIKKYKQDEHPAYDPDDYKELMRKYVLVATFLTNKGYSVSEITADGEAD